MTDKAEIDALVRESGNSFHCKVINFFKEKGWTTLVSPYYMDGATNKPREIDLVVERSWTYGSPYGFPGGEYGAVIIKLFVECKFIAQPNVFWFSGRNIDSARKWVATHTPLRQENGFMGFIDKHHYLASNPKVAKLFASKNKANIENEVMYKALNQSLNAMVYLRRQGSILRDQEMKGLRTLASVTMPVIICDKFDDFYRVEMESPDEPKKIDANFQLEVNYAYLNHEGEHKTEYFLIDVIDFSKLEKFLTVLDADIDAIFEVL